MLIPVELKRYSRQIVLPEIGLGGQELLKAGSVLMIGAGGLGCPVLQYLVAAGVGQIGIVDDDRVDLTNLHRQILYSTDDIGLNKAVTAKKKLTLLNPYVSIEAYPERIKSENAEILLSSYDIIIDGSDNFSTRYLVNDFCISLDKILVSGAIFKFEGQVAVFNYQHGPTYRDLFPDEKKMSTTDNCAEVGVLGVLPGIIGAYMAAEVIKIICNFGEVLSGKLLTVNALDCSTHIFKIQSNIADASNVSLPAKTQYSSESDQQLALVSGEPADSTGDDFITLNELNNWLTNQPDQVILIDVRENYEFEEGNLGGINIPIYELIEHLSEFEQISKLVFYCQSGHRSKLARQLLKPLFNGSTFILKSAV